MIAGTDGRFRSRDRSRFGLDRARHTAEVRANAEGAFTLYPVAGRWRLITWGPGMGRVDREIEVGSQDLQVQLELG